MTEIIWEGTDDDLTAVAGGEFLLCAYKYLDAYRWDILDDNEFELYYDYEPTLESAKAAAVKAYKEHINK